MPTITANGNPFGDSIDNAEITDGTIKIAKLDVDTGTAGQAILVNSGATAFEFGESAASYGKLLASGTFTGQSSPLFTETGLAAHSMYTLVIAITDFSSSTSTDEMVLRVGDGSIDSGTNYAYQWMDNTTNVHTGSATGIPLIASFNQMSYAGVVCMSGTSGTDGGGNGSCTFGFVNGGDAVNDLTIGGRWIVDDKQIDQMSVVITSGTATGFYAIYGRST